MMRIFIDIGHPAHVHYFRNFIKMMQSKGHDLFISARNKEVSQILLEKYSIPYFNRGKGSSNLIGKGAYFFKADWLLYNKALRFKPDIFLSFASPYAAHISKILGKPHIALTDTENAKLGILSFAPLTECILTPSAFLKSFGTKHIKFDGFMELSYLHPKYYSPDPDILEKLNLGSEPFALLRFVSWGANHDLGHTGIPEVSKIELVSELAKSWHVLISSEGKLPFELEKYRIAISPEKMHDVLSFASLYIGEGATMASECAMLGTPAIYINSLTSGTLEKQEKYGLLFGYSSFEKVMEKIREIINTPNFKEELQYKRQNMLSEMIDVSAFLVWFIQNYPESAQIMRENPDYQYNFK
jgi:predicted glycosyltransferase